MALSKENPSAKTQMEDLLDLLIDLQILNSPQKSSEESPSSNGEVSNQGEASSSQLLEESQDSPTNAAQPPVEEGEGEHCSATLHSEEGEGEGEHRSAMLHLGEGEREERGGILSQVAGFESALRPSSQTSTEELEEFRSQDAEPQPLAENGRESFVEQANKPPTTSHNANTPSPPHPLTPSPLHPLTPSSSSNSLSQSSEQQQDKSINQPARSERDLNQPERLNGASEQVLNRLVKSNLQKAQQKEHINQAILSNDEKNVENSIELFERWQRLLLTQEVMDSREVIAEFKKKLESLEHQIYDPTELINLLLPLIAEILSRKVVEAREDIAQAIAPVVDDMIQHRAQQDIQALSSALAPVLPEAVTKQVSNSPGDFARALGPEMGTAIKEQISVERDAMVDALYPVIGSTVSKYFAEAIRTINEKVEKAFSLEGISRKIRAKLQGISEAEIILREAIPFTIQAIFLIHKGSGLVISEVQPLDIQRLESEMVAGMLTAIRSFVNDCIAQSGDISEIDQIEYGNSKIILEVAGYCYIAAVTQGQSPNSFTQKLRGALSNIVQRHGKAIELFDGDPSNVPEQVHQSLEGLTKLSAKPSATRGPLTPVGLLLVSAAVLSAIVLPLGIYRHISKIDSRIEEETNLALASDPQLGVYRLGVEANQGTLKLSGKLPNQYLRSKAEQIAKKVAPKLKINNAIIPVEVPPDPVVAKAEVERVTNILNQVEGAVLTADYQDGKVTVKGTVLQEADAKQVTQAFQQIPGVNSVTNTVQLQPLAIASRIYFDQGSSELKSEEVSKIAQLRTFLDQYPNKHLRLLGHTDPKGTVTENQPLALERATKVKNVLVAQGVDAKRLQVEGTIEPPIGVKAEQVPLLSRCVEFQMITP